MCILHLKPTDAFELDLITQRRGDDITLTVRSFIPISNHPEYHTLLQVTLPSKMVREAGMFLTHEA